MKEKTQTFAVRGDHITLGQFVKMLGVVDTGGEVKIYLTEQAILVNGEAENRRGRKLRPSDSVFLPGHGLVELIADDEQILEEIEEKEKGEEKDEAGKTT